MPKATSCMVHLPTITAPARLSFATTVASRLGIWSLKNSEPDVVRTPAVSRLSLMTIGMPWSNPSQRPSAAARSAATASARAASSAVVTIAFTWPCQRLIAARQASTRARDEFAPAPLLLILRFPIVGIAYRVGMLILTAKVQQCEIVRSLERLRGRDLRRTSIGFGKRPPNLVVHYQKGFTDPAGTMGKPPRVHAARNRAAALQSQARRCNIRLPSSYTAYHSEREVPM